MGTTPIPKKINRSLLTVLFLHKFAAKIHKTEDCWEWQGSQIHGYGFLTIEGERHRTHRIAWTIAYGDIPDGLYVLHRCDNRLCVRPTHLFLGTNLENQEDKIRKGRHRLSSLKGKPAGPLRKIVREYNEERTVGQSSYTVEMEELECGHRIQRKSDIYGPTNAYRRRCRQCLKEA